MARPDMARPDMFRLADLEGKGAGLVAVVHGGLFLREDRTGMLVSGAGVLYFVVFHLLANLPADDELMLGVHERFWIQAGDLLAALSPLRKCARILKHGCVCVHTRIRLHVRM